MPQSAAGGSVRAQNRFALSTIFFTESIPTNNPIDDRSERRHFG